MLYFAYGSNMDPNQIRRRCPSARFVAIARLPDYELAFTIRSTRRRCAAADIVPAPGREVWGVLYRITARRDIAFLDKAEGYQFKGSRKNRYRRSICAVAMDNSRQRVHAQVYFARKDRYPSQPSAAYLDHLRRGAVHWGLPDSYQQFLVELTKI